MRCASCRREDPSVQLRADDRVVCDGCDALTWGPRVPSREAAVAVVDAVVARLELVDVRDPAPCDGCGAVDCPTGGRCPDLTQDDYWDADEAARCWREDQDDDPDPRPGEVDFDA